jgi:hypothetical protein
LTHVAVDHSFVTGLACAHDAFLRRAADWFSRNPIRFVRLWWPHGGTPLIHGGEEDDWDEEVNTPPWAWTDYGRGVQSHGPSLDLFDRLSGDVTEGDVIVPNLPNETVRNYPTRAAAFAALSAACVQYGRQLAGLSPTPS